MCVTGHDKSSLSPPISCEGDPGVRETSGVEDINMVLSNPETLRK